MASTIKLSYDLIQSYMIVNYNYKLRLLGTLQTEEYLTIV
jgi:hypothetical protein